MASTDTSMSINDFDDDDDEDDDDDDITDGKGNNFYQLKSHLKGTKKTFENKIAFNEIETGINVGFINLIKKGHKSGRFHPFQCNSVLLDY